MSEIYYMAEGPVTDRTAENRQTPNKPCTFEYLADVGVYAYKADYPEGIEEIINGQPTSPTTKGSGSNDELTRALRPYGEALMKKFHCQSYDVIECSLGALGGAEGFEALAENHFTEHLHEDDEIRAVLQGSGYFDVRDAEDRWVRVAVGPGDILVVPAGCFHRFTTTADRFIRTMRVFKENPRWVAIARNDATTAANSGAKRKSITVDAENAAANEKNANTDDNAVRQRYLREVVHAPATTAAGPVDPSQNIFSVRYPWKLEEEMSEIFTNYYARLFKGVDTEAGAKEAAAAAQIYVLMTGAIEQHLGYSWCPYCNPAKTTVHEGIDRVKAANAADATLHKRFPNNENVLFIELPVQRSHYLKNPNFPYRLHPVLKVHSVPTVLRLRPSAAAAAAFVGKEANKIEKQSWVGLVEEVDRQHNPQPEFFKA